MQVSLLSVNSGNPIDITIGSARSCYSSKLKLPQEITKWSGKYDLALDLKKSGHHTTLQHIYFTFALDEISRLAIWRFFHAHRFYNSDQVSQRYALINKDNFYIDNSLENKDEIIDLNIQLIKIYEDVIELLKVDFEKSENKVEVKNASKKAMENARYILPQSIFAHMYHTINLSTLLKYYKARKMSPNATDEICKIIEEMVECVIEKYSDLKYLFEDIDNTNKGEQKSFMYSDVLKKCNFSKTTNLRSIQILNKPELEESVNHSFYADTDALYFLFNNMETTTNVKTKLDISLSADSQNQRHRTSVGVREDLIGNIEKNTINLTSFILNQYIPEAVKRNSEALEKFLNGYELIYNVIIKTDKSYAPYLLPNSNKIIIIENTNFSDLIHKSKTRLCLNAQEEIRFATYELIEELMEANISVDMFAPPCVFNNLSNIKPTCTEGDRFCGIKEWKSKKYVNIKLK